LIVSCLSRNELALMEEHIPGLNREWLTIQGGERELGIDVEVRTGDETALKKASRGEDLYGQALWRDNEARKDGGSILRSQYTLADYSARAHNDHEIYKLAQVTTPDFGTGIPFPSPIPICPTVIFPVPGTS